MSDDLCKALPPEPPRPGRRPSLSRAEVVCLALLSQWSCFTSEVAFYAYAGGQLRGAFPGLPALSQFNRLLRRHQGSIAAVALALAHLLATAASPYEVLDTLPAITRGARRRGRGWLPGQADIGWSTRLHWYEGFKVLLATTEHGVITGFGFGPASANERTLADTFFAHRAAPHPGLGTVGLPAAGPYLADKGFEGASATAQWQQQYGAQVIVPPRRTARAVWPRAWARWFGGLRQIIETTNAQLLGRFRLDRERPHTREGFSARLAAKVGLHNFCVWLNLQHGRAPLAFAELAPF